MHLVKLNGIGIAFLFNFQNKRGVLVERPRINYSSVTLWWNSII